MSIARELFWWTLTVSWAAACLSLLVWLLLGVAGKRLPPPAHYWLWSLVLIRLCLPIVPTTSWSPLAGLAVWTSWAEPKGAQLSSMVPSLHQAPSVAESEHVGKSVSVSEVPVIDRSADAAFRGVERASGWTDWLTLLWLAGGVGYLGLVALQHRRFARRLKLARAGTVECERLLKECRRKLGMRTAVRVDVLDVLDSPAVYGFFRPRLLLPSAKLAELKAEELSHILLHELVHVRRGDIWLNWIWILARAWHWFNPLVWLALRRLEAEREILCDATVLSVLRTDERPAYGATLLRLVASLPAKTNWPASAPVPGVVSVLAQTQTQLLERRIRMIAQPRRFSPGTLVLALLLITGLAALTFTRAAEKPAPPPLSQAPAGAPAPEPTAIPAPKPSPGAARSTRLRAEQSLQTLEDELDKNRVVIRSLEEQLNEMKARFGITEPDEERGGSTLSAESLRALEVKRIEAEAERARSLATYKVLTNASRSELRRMLPTAHPDSLLEKLLAELAQLQLQRARFEGEIGAENLEVQRNHRVMATLESQIDDRLEGLLRGLKVLLDSQTEQLDTMRMQIELAKKVDIARFIERRPYYQLKRELENNLMFQERLQARLLQDRLESRLAR